MRSIEVLIVMLLATLEFCLGMLVGIALARRAEALADEVPAVLTVPAVVAAQACPDWGRHGY